MRIVKLVVAVVAALAVVVIAAVGFVYLAPERATRFAIDAERQRAGLVRKEIDLPSGLHYVYLEGGQGEPLMLLHGFGANKDNFARVARFLTAGDSVEKRITGLATPTLIVWGDQDRAIHVATANVLHKLMPHSQVIIMPGIGHLPMIERPQQSADDYLRFRASLTGHSRP